MSAEKESGKQDIDQFEGLATNADGERLPFAFVLDTRKRTGVFAMGPFGAPQLALSSLKKLKIGSGLVGRARSPTGLVDWSITAFEAGTECKIEIKEGDKTSQYVDVSILLFHWFLGLRLPKA